MFELDVCLDAASWRSVLDTFPEYDMYHTYDYHAISSSKGEGEPLLLVVKDRDGRNLLCWPTLRRGIDGTGLHDLTSVYGYCGPLLADYEIASSCYDFLFASLREMGVVTLFSRMHPLLVRALRDEALRGTRLENRLVVIDTRRQNDGMQGYRPNHRRDIRKALASGVGLVVDEDGTRIDEFISIYHQAMRDLHCADYFFFDREHLERLMTGPYFKTFVIFAQLDGIDIGAAMFITTRNIMHYYIGGVVEEFKGLSPLKVILARADEIARLRGVHNLILGVGRRGGKDDTLYRFKKGFSELDFPLYIFKRVIDREAYARICAAAGIDVAAADYFPAYRQPPGTLGA